MIAILTKFSHNLYLAITFIPDRAFWQIYQGGHLRRKKPSHQQNNWRRQISSVRNQDLYLLHLIKKSESGLLINCSRRLRGHRRAMHCTYVIKLQWWTVRRDKFAAKIWNAPDSAGSLRVITSRQVSPSCIMYFNNYKSALFLQKVKYEHTWCSILDTLCSFPKFRARRTRQESIASGNEKSRTTSRRPEKEECMKWRKLASLSSPDLLIKSYLAYSNWHKIVPDILQCNRVGRRGGNTIRSDFRQLYEHEFSNNFIWEQIQNGNSFNIAHHNGIASSQNSECWALLKYS